MDKIQAKNFRTIWPTKLNTYSDSVLTSHASIKTVVCAGQANIIRICLLQYAKQETSIRVDKSTPIVDFNTPIKFEFLENEILHGNTEENVELTDAEKDSVFKSRHN